jgi:hypothetical protein
LPAVKKATRWATRGRRLDSCDTERTPPRSLGYVHRLVGAADQRGDVHLAPLGLGDPDTERHTGATCIDSRVEDPHGLLQLDGGPFSANRGRVGQDNQKLIAAESAADIRRPQDLSDSCSECFEDDVSSQVPPRVIDGLEVVDVDHQHREGLAGSSRSPQFLLQIQNASGTIQAPGQRVNHALLLEIAKHIDIAER